MIQICNIRKLLHVFVKRMVMYSILVKMMQWDSSYTQESPVPWCVFGTLSNPLTNSPYISILLENKYSIFWAPKRNEPLNFGTHKTIPNIPSQYNLDLIAPYPVISISYNHVGAKFKQIKSYSYLITIRLYIYTYTCPYTYTIHV